MINPFRIYCASLDLSNSVKDYGIFIQIILNPLKLKIAMHRA